MDEKLPAPCEHCRASGLRHGSVCEECQGKGYRLFINGSRTPERLKRPPHQWRGPRRPPQRKRWRGGYSPSTRRPVHRFGEGHVRPAGATWQRRDQRGASRRTHAL